ncbi:MAG: HNH endonuclease signature motif containing protein [Burkholderiaceae bacterium]
MATRLIPESIRDVIDYRPKTGELIWLESRGRFVKAGDVAGSNFKGYIRITYKGVAYLAHRVAWFLSSGEQPGEEIDHINGNKSDNRICNLRSVNKSQNLVNQHRTGVTWQRATVKGKNYPFVQAKYRGKHIYKGQSILLAYHARIMAEREDHPIGLPHA